MENDNIVKMNFIAEGTTCESCEKIIKKQAYSIEGVEKVEFDYSTEAGSVTFDRSKTDIDKILYKIEEKGYKCFILDQSKDDIKNKSNILGWVFGIAGILIAGYFILNLVDQIQFPQLSQNMGYGLLFLVGLLTGFHCVSMCGGFVMSYTAKNAQEGKKSHKSHLMYGLGKTISYTIIGAVFGLIGSLIAFTPMMRGVAGVIAGLFLVLFGLKMLNIFPVLRKIQFRTPMFIQRFVGKKQAGNSSPLMIGLLNGLMIACGPLQAIYIMAAGTGSMLEGAKLLFVFALGTLPVMLGFGYFASFISTKMTHKILKASGVIVIILGIFMLNNGLVLTGSGFDVGTMVSFVSASNRINGDTVKTDSQNFPLMNNGYQEIRMEVNRYGWEPDKFVLKKGVPVRWIINGLEINGCNNAIQVPKYNLKFDIKRGEQVIEFTPDEEGIVSWSCWMGMIPGRFIVKDDIDLSDSEEIQKELDEVVVPAGGSCGGGSGGGCGCGGSR
ncbi:MAG: sulfite exporter TauE/SafE family protein [Candidatus Woesearchaeota archaeon]